MKKLTFKPSFLSKVLAIVFAFYCAAPAFAGTWFTPFPTILKLNKPETNPSDPTISMEGTISPLQLTIEEQLKTKATIRLELFVMSQCPYGVDAEEVIIPILKKFGERVEFKLRFVASLDKNNGIRSLHGQPEVEENGRQAIIAKRYPGLLLDYLLARAKNYGSDDWKAAAQSAGISTEAVERLAASSEGKALLLESIRPSMERNIRSSPTIFVDGQKYAGGLVPVKRAKTAVDISTTKTLTTSEKLGRFLMDGQLLSRLAQKFGFFQSPVMPGCGDGFIDAGSPWLEECDDSNNQSGDGCSSTCKIETPFTCTGEPSVCVNNCGDGIVAGSEVCDDGNTTSGDGCDATCEVESEFTCTGEPSVCISCTPPGTTEICDGQDNNCDGFVDEGLAGLTYTGNVTFSNQSELDAWPPCFSIIVGNLTISGTNITDLSPMNSLTEVTGRIEIEDNPVLLQITGFQALQSIGGDFYIEGNDALMDVTGFGALMTAGRLSIVENGSLTDVTGFPVFTSTNQLTIEENALLTDVTGFTTLNAVGYVSIENNPSLLDITGFALLSTVSSGFYIIDNESLWDITGFASLDAVEGELNIKDNPSLNDVSGFTTLSTIGEDLKIEQNTALTDVSGFAALESVGENFEIRNNPILANVSGFAALEMVSEDFEISDNALDEDDDDFGPSPSGDRSTVKSNRSLVGVGVSGFGALTTVGGWFNISNNTHITSINGFSALFSVAGDFEISNNAMLTEASGFSALSSVGEDFQIKGNELLTDVSGFTALNSADDITIGSNEMLTNIGEFTSLVNMDGSINISENALLTNLDCFAALVSLTRSLYVSNNTSLTDVDGLSSLSSVGGDLYIFNNSMLSDCCGIQELVNTPGAIGRIIFITGNQTGCESLPVVQNATCSSDEDGDGVNDIDDNCPGTPTDETVNTEGCSCSQVTVDDGIACTLDECLDGEVTHTPIDADMDGISACDGDCDDNAAAINPNTIWFKDVDGDGHSDGATLVQCAQPLGYQLATNLTATSGDCNDNNGAIHPDATEICDGIDNDCDNLLDVADPSLFDITPPAISCPVDIVQNNDPDMCSAVVTYMAPDGTDNCTGQSTALTEGLASGSAFPVGLTTVTYTVTDVKNSTTSCSFSVTVKDVTPPVITCKDATLVLNNDGTGVLSPIEVYLSHVENCGTINIFSVSPSSFSCADVGKTTMVTLYASDLNGNAGTCTSKVTVVDNTGPALACKNATVALSAIGKVSITYEDVLISATDVCGGSSMSLDKKEFTCFNVGPNAVKLTATDVNGNSSTCLTTVAIIGNPAINTGATEICDGIDNNCNGRVDEGFDLDGDGFTTCAGDCNDNNVNIYPGALELCDGIDNNCNGLVDEGVTPTWYADADGDGFGNPASSILACAKPAGYVSNNEDCDDASASVKPDGQEICDGLDNNCDGLVDFGIGDTWYADNDGDGFGNAAKPVQACTAPVGYISNHTDCDDLKAAIFPGATEICNGLDDNCDGLIDEGLSKTWYADADGDGYGNPDISISVCAVPLGFVDNNTDCNDNPANGGAAVHPGAAELCNGIDDNCNGLIDDGIAGLVYVGNVTFSSQAQVNAWSQCYGIIQGNLHIMFSGVVDLTKLGNITKVTGYVTIQYTNLTTLNGLNSLTEIGGDLTIHYNAKLTTLQGLNALTKLGGGLGIYYNGLLSDCCSIYGLLNSGGISGYKHISGNKTGCDSVTQVKTSCVPAMGNPGFMENVTVPSGWVQDVLIYPNPTTGRTFLHIGDSFTEGKLDVYDLNGKVILSQNLDGNSTQLELDLKGATPGIYLTRVILDGRVFTKRLVVE